MLEIIINDGIKVATEDYNKPEQKEHLEGSVDGFNACRNLDVAGLIDMYKTANKYVKNAYDEKDEKYWYFRCYQAEIEWVINVVSALFILHDEKVEIIDYLPTVNGMSKAMHVMSVLERKK